MNNDLNKGKYAAQYRKDSKVENLPGQNVISNTSIVEQGREAESIRRVADLYEGTTGCGCKHNR
jgi:hypothetical protein